MREHGNTENKNGGSARPVTERADEWLDRAGHTAGMFASLAGFRLAKIAAFAREEFEDMWAEAQSMRAGRQEAGPSAQTTGGGTETEREVAEPERETTKTEDRTQAAGTTETEGRPQAAGTTETEGRPQAAGTTEAEDRAQAGVTTETGDKAETIQATDSARRRAEELGVDLRKLKGTGVGGRITVEDVRKKAEKSKGK